jgi:hypothetical protein
MLRLVEGPRKEAKTRKRIRQPKIAATLDPASQETGGSDAPKPE